MPLTLSDLPTPRPWGFTLLEVMVAMAISAVLATAALPSFQRAIHKARRADALVALVRVQTAQARYRANHRSYGSLADIQLSNTSADGHYKLALEQPAATGYVVLAQATGAQAADTECRHLRLTVDGTQLLMASGSDAGTANPPQLNRSCWAR
jgi:type IV pilus assembly protein PilE